MRLASHNDVLGGGLGWQVPIVALAGTAQVRRGLEGAHDRLVRFRVTVRVGVGFGVGIRVRFRFRFKAVGLGLGLG